MNIKQKRKKHQLHNNKEDLKTKNASLDKIEEYLYKIASGKNEEDEHEKDNTIMEEGATKTDVEKTNVKEQHSGTFEDILQEELKKITKDYLVKYKTLDLLLQYIDNQINVISSLHKNNDASYYRKNKIYYFVSLKNDIYDTQCCLTNTKSEIEEDYRNITRDISNLYIKNLDEYLKKYFFEGNNYTKKNIFPNIVNIIKRRINRFKRNIEKIGNFYSAVPIPEYEKYAKEKHYGGVAFNSVFNTKNRPIIIERYKENDYIKEFICDCYSKKPIIENEKANIDNLSSIKEYINKIKNEKKI